MAKAITEVPATFARDSAIQNPASLSTTHQDSLSEALRLLDLMNERGLLRLLIAVLEQGEEALRIVVEQADKPGAVGGIKNGIALIQGLSELNPTGLHQLFKGIGAATKLSNASSEDQVSIHGLFDVMRLLQDRDVTAGLEWVFTALKGIGREVQQCEE